LARKTLLFCTSFASDEAAWRARQRRWLDHHLALPLERDAVFVIDDASPWRPTDADLAVLDAVPASLPAGPAAFVYRFELARALGCTRIVHVESDAFLLSRKIVDRINALDDGWTAFWCPLYNFPEPALQVIAQDSFDAMASVAARGLDALTTSLAEFSLPFTRVERGYAGNRYGETRGRIPGYADYACQVNSPAMIVKYRG
jgi:hypothetical protein